MLKKISTLAMLCALSVAAYGAQYPLGVGSAPVSATNPLPSVIYDASNGHSAAVQQEPNGAWGLNVTGEALNVLAPANVQSSAVGLLTLQSNTQGVYQQGTIAAGATVATLTPPANNALAMWSASITSNATLAVAGTDTVTVALNGVILYQTSVYIPATALSSSGQMWSHWEHYDSFVVPKVGSAGTFTVTLGTALATGTVNVNEASGH